jgi:flavorubredoxin
MCDCEDTFGIVFTVRGDVMSRILITFWSGTGNTEKMAELIAEGAKAKGAEVDCKHISVVDGRPLICLEII